MRIFVWVLMLVLLTGSVFGADCGTPEKPVCECGDKLYVDHVMTRDITCGDDKSFGIYIVGNGATLDCNGHTIRFTGTDDDTYFGIKASAIGITIKNCIVENFASDGIYMHMPYNSKAINNILRGNENGLRIGDTTENVEVRGNVFENNEFGLKVFGNNGRYKHFNITNNTAINNTCSGMYLITKEDIRVEQNEIRYNGFACEDNSAQEGGIYINGYFNHILDNNIIDNDGIGLYAGVFNTSILDNTIQGGNTGIFVKGGGANILERNKLTGMSHRGIDARLIDGEYDPFVFNDNTVCTDAEYDVYCSRYLLLVGENNVLTNAHGHIGPCIEQGYEPCEGDEMPPVCGNGILEGEEECDDGNYDQYDDCNLLCQITDTDPHEICSNTIDDDADGLVDCLDDECPPCEQYVEHCENGFDDDNDGFVDCLDSDCVDSTNCVEPEDDEDPDETPDEICDNAFDDDGDGYSDCYDSDCEEECQEEEDDNPEHPPDEPEEAQQDGSQYYMPPPTTEIVCNDGIDNDYDGFADCLDPDCSASCQPDEDNPVVEKYIESDIPGINVRVMTSSSSPNCEVIVVQDGIMPSGQPAYHINTVQCDPDTQPIDLSFTVNPGDSEVNVFQGSGGGWKKVDSEIVGNQVTVPIHSNGEYAVMLHEKAEMQPDDPTVENPVNIESSSSAIPSLLVGFAVICAVGLLFVFRERLHKTSPPNHLKVHKFVDKHMDKGYTEANVRSTLGNSGWHKDDIRKAIDKRRMRKIRNSRTSLIKDNF
ncbi:MAG: right-handed parallel beta-helix repeat-containing protein [Nanoarchaeota archaeon]|nr:right-handed parallel beta-helix repeat-containing protein [Nanoarchaeota archaeon]